MHGNVSYLNGRDGEPPPHRPPPHNLEVEQALLGAILINNAAYARISDLLVPTDYFDELHQAIHATAGQLIEAGERADPITLKTRFERTYPIEGGLTVPQYLGRLAVNATTIINVRGYASLIRDLAIRRQLVVMSEDLANAAYDAPVDFPPLAQLAEFRTRADSIAAHAGGTLGLRVVSAASFAHKPVPPREWHARGLIPANDATGLNGDGGTGKSIIAAQLAVATPLGRPWLGCEVKRGPVIYLGAEDDLDEMHRRFSAIARHQGVSFDRLSDLHICCLAGHDANLATVDDSGNVRPTALWHQFRQLVTAIRPALIVYDTLADLFGGDENNRRQARQFVGMLRGLAIETPSAALLLSHPSLTGMASGAGTSGSTAWSNSVRSRLYLERVKENGAEPDPNARVLRTMKSNYGPTGGQIRLRWHEGVFLLESDDVAGAAAAKAQSAHDEGVFLALLGQFVAAGRKVGETPGVSYAPARFAETGEGKPIGQKRLAAAMARLFARGAIRLIDYGRPSRPHRRLEVV